MFSFSMLFFFPDVFKAFGFGVLRQVSGRGFEGINEGQSLHEGSLALYNMFPKSPKPQP